MKKLKNTKPSIYPCLSIISKIYRNFSTQFFSGYKEIIWYDFFVNRVFFSTTFFALPQIYMNMDIFKHFISRFNKKKIT
jgi:hypothetical protein